MVDFFRMGSRQLEFSNQEKRIFILDRRHVREDLERISIFLASVVLRVIKNSASLFYRDQKVQFHNPNHVFLSNI